MNKAELLKKLDQLDNRLQNLFIFLKPHSEEILNAQPKPESWSAIQVCHHIMLAESTSLAYLKKKLSYNPKLSPVTLSTTMRRKLMLTYMATPLKFSAPKGISGEHLPAYSSLDEVSKKWEATRSEMRTFLSELSEELFDKEIFKHAFAGKLSLEGMILFFEGHMARHEKQIRKALMMVQSPGYVFAQAEAS